MRRKKYDRRKVFPYFSLLLHVNHSIKHTQVKLHISSSYAKVCLCTLPLLPIVTACHDNATNNEPDKAPVRRTVLIYMAAQNSLHKNAQSDSAEIMNGRQYIADNDRLLMFVDDERAPRLYRVTRRCKEPVLLRRWDKDICSTDPEQLREVLSWCDTTMKPRNMGWLCGHMPRAGCHQPIATIMYIMCAVPSAHRHLALTTGQELLTTMARKWTLTIWRKPCSKPAGIANTYCLTPA